MDRYAATQQSLSAARSAALPRRCRRNRQRPPQACSQVVEIDGQRILLAAVDGAVKAVSNKCSHLGLPLVGKTSVFQAEVANG